MVIEDSLGIAETLETEMQVLVDTFECEWKQVLEKPRLMDRFRHFVNSNEKDENIEFVSLRDQKMQNLGNPLPPILLKVEKKKYKHFPFTPQQLESDNPPS